MQVLIAIVVAVAIAAIAGVVLLARRRSRSAAAAAAALATPDSTPVPHRIPDEPRPMNDLESALASVTDRTGHPMRERIDAETDHIDELRVADDTGPLLRRALDHVANPTAHATTSEQPAAAHDPLDPADPGPSGTPSGTPGEAPPSGSGPATDG